MNIVWRLLVIRNHFVRKKNMLACFYLFSSPPSWFHAMILVLRAACVVLNMCLSIFLQFVFAFLHFNVWYAMCNSKVTWTADIFPLSLLACFAVIVERRGFGFAFMTRTVMSKRNAFTRLLSTLIWHRFPFVGRSLFLFRLASVWAFEKFYARDVVHLTDTISKCYACR